MRTIQTGLENFLAAPLPTVAGQRLGLLCNPASVDVRYRHARDRIAARLPGQLTALFSPQHGFHAAKQDNMVESEDDVDPQSGLPVYSLYSRTRVPTAAMFEAIDVLLVDLQDVGTRVYTFIYTLSYCMEAARRHGKPVVILDRPNPIDGLRVEGNRLKPDCASFVGRYPLPMRHGLTIGELALLFNTHFGIGCELEVVPMNGWRRDMRFTATGLPWVPPSPNLPTPTSALVYPGQVLWEGTNVSEGRGTTQPFELFGAPFFDCNRILAEIEAAHLPGVLLRPTVFEPTANKWAGQACHGFQLHVTDPRRFAPYASSLELLRAAILCHPTDFAWKEPPYEYEFERRPIDLLIGDRELRRRIEAGARSAELAAAWEAELEAFRALSRSFWLYR